MKTARWARVVPAALLVTLACSERAERGVQRSEPDAAAAVAARTAAARPESGEAPAPAAGSSEEYGALRCPDQTEPAELALPFIDTVMRWCVRTGPDGGRLQHGPWRKERAGDVVESGSYEDGQRHGRWTFHWDSGPAQSSGEYREGFKAGVWTFWDQNGAELRRVDYGDPAAEAAGDAEATTAEAKTQEAPESEPVEVSLLVENSHATDVIFALEPWAEEYDMAPGATFEVSASGPEAGELVVESSEQAITVWAWEGSEVQLWYNGVEVMP